MINSNISPRKKSDLLKTKENIHRTEFQTPKRRDQGQMTHTDITLGQETIEQVCELKPIGQEASREEERYKRKLENTDQNDISAIRPKKSHIALKFGVD